ncbi:MAG TPA: serine/threonine-protein kinase, partial [Gemmataceae bacterium]|nr:serine/threonine-protein kinase [Gemmataceae bacterium]
MIEQGWLTAGGKAVVEQLVEFKLRKHGGSVQASLAAAAGPEARSALASVHDRDVEQSLATLEQAACVTPNGNSLSTVDPFATAAPSESAGRNVLYEEIGRGGMGRVLRGHDSHLRRELAVKVLREEHGDNPDAERRFIEEAQIGGQLQHPGVVPVYELGRFPDRRPFFTMKLVKGRTLAQFLKERPDPAHDEGHFLGIFERVCQTMAYAHSKRVIHRDLKPGNIMIGPFGEVMVMDWGLAKVLPYDSRRPEEGATGGTVIRTGRTDSTEGQDGHTGIVGTPAFMAPEQARGEAGVDERADVFGLGGILCVILTGQSPHFAAVGEDIIRRAAHGAMSDAFARLDGCGADALLTTLCKDCLAPCREARPRDAAEVLARLTAHLADVEERLRKAELDRAAAEAKAVEEQQRRRMMSRLARLALGAAVIFLLLALAARLSPRRQRELELFLDRAAPPDARLATIPRLPLDDDGAFARVLWDLRGETDPALVGPALAGLADGVAAGRVSASGRAAFIVFLQESLADIALDPTIHRAAFDSLRRVGRPAAVLAGVLGYLRADSPQPLEGDFLHYLAKSPDVTAAYRGDSPEAARARENLLRQLRRFVERRVGDVRAAALALFVREAPARPALDLAVAQHNSAPPAEEPALRAILLSTIGRVDLGRLDDPAQLDLLWQLAELLRRPGQPEDVVTACVGLLDGEPTAALCDALYKAYMTARGIDGKGTPPDESEAADVILMPYAARTRKEGRLPEIQGHILGQLQALIAGGGGEDLADSAALPYLLGAVGRLRAAAGKPWPEALAALRHVLMRYPDLDRSVLPLLLGSLVAVADDGPAPFGEFQPIREMLAGRQMPLTVQAAAAAALGNLHDAASVPLLQAVAARADRVSSVRVAAVHALGALGRYLKAQGR